MVERVTLYRAPTTVADATEALEGYVLQAVHYLRTGEAFCEEPGCRLFDAHRQGALIEAQVDEPEFCPAHAEVYG